MVLAAQGQEALYVPVAGETPISVLGTQFLVVMKRCLAVRYQVVYGADVGIILFESR